MNLDNELIEGLKKHDDKAYLTLFDHVYSPLHELAFMYVLDYDTANDIVQDTFINLYENSFLLDKVHNLEGYLRIAVRNRCYNYLRDLALEDQRKKLYWEEFLESETDNFDKAEFEIILKKIQEVMDVLPDRCGDNIGITWRDMETFFRYGNKIRGFHYKKRPLFYYVIMLF